MVFIHACCFACGHREAPDRPLVAGPAVHVCRPCVERALVALLEARRGPTIVLGAGPGPRHPRCAFCGERDQAATGMAVWPAGAVCGGCLLLAEEILGARAQPPASRPAG